MSKRYEFWQKVSQFPKRPPVQPESNEPIEPPKEISPDERRIQFRRYLTELVSEGWKIEIENEFDAVVSYQSRSGLFIAFVWFIILLLIFAPLAFFYLAYVIVTRLRGKQKLSKVWIDIYGNIKTNS